MASVKLSNNGRVACGGSFIDIYGRRPPAAIRAVHSLGVYDTPPLVSWSSFPSHKKTNVESYGKDDRNMNKEGEHVALAFSCAQSASLRELFFSVGVFRCDTWALQWAVSAKSVGEGQRICDICCLSAQAIAFIVERDNGNKNNKNDSKQRNMGRRQLYIATRADVPRVGKKANRQWRSFLADAHLVETGFDQEDVCSVQAFSATSCLILTSAGRLIYVTLSISPSSVEVKSTEVEVEGALITLEKKKNTLSVLVVSGTADNSADESVCYAAVFAAGGQTLCVMQLTHTTITLRASRPQFISVSSEDTIERVEFAGPHILVVTTACNNKSSFAFSMTCIARSTLPPSPSETPFSLISFDPLQMRANFVPLATTYCAERETHIVLVSRCHHSDKIKKNNKKKKVNYSKHSWDSNCFNNADSWWSYLEYAELELRDGPYTEEMFKNAVWRSLPGPRYSILRTVAKANMNGMGKSGDDGGYSDDEDYFSNDLQKEIGGMLGHSKPSECWELLNLHYAIATCPLHDHTQENDKERVIVNVLAIETAPFLHTRLAKQWHNATHGLRSLFGKSHETVSGLPPFAVAWNPRHVRRVLRLFSQEELCQFFGHIANTLRVSAQQSNAASLFYGSAAAAVADVALQIITLSRQIGAVLSQDDVAVVALLLRASREAGHLVVNYTTRGCLLLESVVKSRLASRLLGEGVKKKIMSHSDEGIHGNEEVNGEENDEERDEFFHGLTELRVEKTLHARYAPNSWVKHLLLRQSEHANVVAGTIERLKGVSFLQPPHNISNDIFFGEQKQNGGGNSHCNSDSHYLDEEMTGGSGMLPDWMLLGRRAHANFAFTEYESALLRTTTNKSA